MSRAAPDQRSSPGTIREPRMFGVVVTYRRPAELATMLSSLAEQSRRPDLLMVVDNSPSQETEEVVRDNYPTGQARYWGASDNLGPAGGIAAGMHMVLELADDEDWILFLDDDNPPPSATVLDEVFRFGQEMLAADPSTAAVGLTGARVDWRRGSVYRAVGAELFTPVPVDFIGGSRLLMYRVAAIRDVGVYLDSLFFGWGDLEYGLRLKRAGYSLYTHGPLWLQLMERFRELRSMTGYADTALRRRGWRWYYGLRNLIYIFRLQRRRWTALRVTIQTGLTSPLGYLLTSRMSARDVALSWRACRDGWRGRLGRTVEPGGGRSELRRR